MRTNTVRFLFKIIALQPGITFVHLPRPYQFESFKYVPIIAGIALTSFHNLPRLPSPPSLNIYIKFSHIKKETLLIRNKTVKQF